MIQLRIDGLDGTLRGISRLADTDRRPMMDQIGAYGVLSTQERFESGTSPEGTKWQKSQRAKSQGGQTLVNKGHLLQSVTHRATGSSAEWGSNRIYAGIHQLGGVIRPVQAKALAFRVNGRFVTARQVKIPARPYLGVNEGDRNEIGAIVADWMKGCLK